MGGHVCMSLDVCVCVFMFVNYIATISKWLTTG